MDSENFSSIGDSQFFFLGGADELNNINENDLVKLIPYGIQISSDGSRPMMLLKDEKGELTLPVILNPLEAGVTLTQSNKSIVPVTPHKVTEILMEGLSLSFESCLFIEIKGSQQYVRLNIKGHSDLKYIKVRADEAMSFCLHFKIPFYASRPYIAQSRILISEDQVKTQQALVNSEVLNKQHKYMM